VSIRIEHRLGVAAPARVIWDVYKDVADWPSWNPSYPAAEGKLTIGGALRLTMTPPGGEPQASVGTIVDWVPETQLLWRSKLYGGLLTSTRWVEIEVLDEAACIISNGEIFDGPLEGLVSRRRRGQAYRAFEAMNEAIKTRAESAWAEEQKGAKPEANA